MAAIQSLLVVLTLIATVHPAGSQLNSPAGEILPSILCQEILHCQSHFQLHLCAELFLLKLVPSLNDVVSDFLMADAYSSSNDTIVQSWVTNYSYAAICYPAMYLTFSLLHHRFKRHRTALSLACVLLITCSLLFFNIYIFPTMPMPRVLFLPAACVAALLLSSKALAVLVHGPTTQRLAAIVAPYESRAECLHQLIIAMAMLMSARVGAREWKPYYSLITSFLILGRDVAEQLLGSGPDLLAGRSLRERLGAIRRLLPSILSTAVFRIGSHALLYCSILAKEVPPIVIWFLLIYGPPFFLIVFLKRHFLSIQQLSSYDILLGITDECASCAVWGNLDRQAARIPQLVTQVHFFLLYGSFCTWKAVSPITDQNTDLRIFAVSLLCMGFLSVALFLSDIFFKAANSHVSPESEEALHGLKLLRDNTVEMSQTSVVFASLGYNSYTRAEMSRTQPRRRHSV